MMRAIRVLAPGERQGRRIVDTALLDHAQRSAGKASATTVRGEPLAIELKDAVRLRTDDLLLLDDGGAIEVVAAPEALIEARAADLSALMRLAWHLGDRHVPVQMLNNRIRVRQDAAIKRLLEALGAKVTSIEAPFEPEGGAYESQAHRHDHHHAHDHDHDHDRHGHHHRDDHESARRG